MERVVQGIAAVRRHGKSPGRAACGFAADERGSLIIFSMLLFVTMLLVGGLAVDVVRFEANRARLQSTLDRAVLAAASLDQTAEPVDVVLDYFARANLDAYIGPDDITSVTSLTSRQVTAEAGMDMPTTFTRLLGFESFYAPSAGTAEESASRTEISLVLDVSGSMSWWSSSGGGSKISLLREAATEFVNILMCNPADPSATTNCVVEPDTVSITMVPYSQQVVAGESLLEQLSVTAEHQNSACITFEAADFEDVGIDPAVLYKRTGNFDWAWWRSHPSSWECPTDSWRQILPMENQAQDLRDAIHDLGASGNTSIDLGTKWGAAFLDPSFRPVVQGLVDDGLVAAAFDDRPYDYTESGVNKIIVLMTDGVNTTQYYLKDEYRSGPSGIFYNTADPDRLSVAMDDGNYYWFDDHDYWWEWNWTIQDHPYGDEEPGDAVEYSFPQLWERYTLGWYDALPYMDYPASAFYDDEKNDQLDAICEAAKARNITIFAIGFEVTSASGAVMSDCASSPAHYFAVDGTDLSDAFNAIARQITALRLVN